MTDDDPLAQIVAKAKARFKVLSCTSCELREHCTKPVPFTHPGGRPDFAVLGEAPGRSEDRKGRPMIGMASRLMRRMLRDAGLEPGGAGWLNVVSCFPHGTLSQVHRDACAPNMRAQLDALDPPFVVAAGAVAFAALVPDVKLARIHGSLIRVHNRWVLPVWHPAKVLREPDLRPVVVGALEHLAAVLLGADPLNYRAARCIECGVTADLWDERQVAYCTRHRREMHKWQGKETRRRTKVNKQSQPALPLETT